MSPEDNYPSAQGRQGKSLENPVNHTFQAASPKQAMTLHPVEILTKLKETGLVLLRGFDFDLNAFEVLTKSWCDSFHGVAARASMQIETSDGYTTHVPEVNFVLLVHSEGVYIPHPFPPYSAPDLAFFYCQVPPQEKGGETMLADGVEFLKRLPVDLIKRFRNGGVTYEALWDEERWRLEFPVKDKHALKELLDVISSVEYQFEGDNLRFRYNTAAITQTMAGLWSFSPGLLAHLPHFNHPRYADKYVYTKSTNKVFFGDGEEIDDATINLLVDIQDDIVINHAWKTNDLVIVENTRFMHGRTMSEKPCERVIFSRFGMLKHHS
jgi:alpha-ketoglutarate-dependent taurine dioxygenase